MNVKEYTRSINTCRTAAYKSDVAACVLRKLREQGVDISLDLILALHVYVDAAVRSKVRRLELAREHEILKLVNRGKG